MRVIIAGPRDFNDLKFIQYHFLKTVKELISLHLVESIKDVIIVSGRARGVDTCGEQLADMYNLEKLLFPADWDQYGKKAGYIRNTKMAENADILLAFDKGSIGTSMMIDIALRKNITTFIIKI